MLLRVFALALSILLTMASAAASQRHLLADRLAGAIYGIAIGDALSSPVHWYYSQRDLLGEFGLITDYLKPKEKHPSSILNLSNTGGAGRGGKEGNIIGDVINHGMKKYWMKPGTHYHATLQAGENTLNTQVSRLLVRTMVEKKRYDVNDFLSSYITFMTTPGSHNDVSFGQYAGNPKS
jgi:ADP-ribosyl-[dinitrogen reductase] hydrolase